MSYRHSIILRSTSLVVLCLVLGTARTAQAQTDAFWIGPGGTGGDGNYNVASNWDINQVPNGNFNVFIDDGLVASSTVTLNINAAINNLNISNTDALRIANTEDFTVNGDAINNAGTIGVDSTGATTDLEIGNAATTLSGGGVVELSNNANNRIIGTSVTNRLINQDNTIQGSGQIGANLLEITNQSLIQANQGVDLTIDPRTELINTGTLRATNGATMNLNTGTYTNTGGVIEAEDNSFVDLQSGAFIDGGTLQTSGSGVIRNVSNNATLKDLTIDGRFVTTNTGDTNLRGTITNSAATIEINSTGATTDLQIDSAEVTLTGGGTVQMSNNVNNRIIGNAVTNRLINQDNTIQGSGQIGANLMRFTNQGTVIANQATNLVIDTRDADSFTNEGVLRADSAFLDVQNTQGELSNLSGNTLTGGTYEAVNGGTIQVDNLDVITNAATILLDGAASRLLDDTTNSSGLRNFAINEGSFTLLNGAIHDTPPFAALTNSGTVFIGETSNINVDVLAAYIQTAGTTTVNGTLLAGEVDIKGGTLLGNGTVNVIADVLVDGGAVNPGASTGELEIIGDYRNTAAGTLLAEIGGTEQGVTYDFLNIDGNAAIEGGILDVSLVNNFAPLVGQVFTILEANSVTGVFDTELLPTFNNLPIFDVVYTGTQVQLVTINAIPEPSTLLMLGVGLGGLAAWRVRQRRRAAA